MAADRYPIVVGVAGSIMFWPPGGPRRNVVPL